MSKPTYTLRGRVWLYPGMTASWHFVTLSKKAGKDIKEMFGESDRGFGSIPVVVTIGSTSWKTSIFPDKESGSYLLPLKADVRKREDIKDGSSISYTIELQV